MKRARKQTKAATKKGKPRPKKAPGASNSGSDYGEAAPTMRFEATIHPPRQASPNWVDQLDIDRIPDPKGMVRALVTAADCVRLLDLGLQVHLHHALPVRPLDPALIEKDDAFRRWLDKKIKNIKPPTKPKGPKAPKTSGDN
jgi:hypothetical protein